VKIASHNKVQGKRLIIAVGTAIISSLASQPNFTVMRLPQIRRVYGH
jgi:hypothetical protein